MTSAEALRRQLKELGLTNEAVGAAWPRWWSEDAEASPSARAELRFSVARRLGLDPETLLEERGAPQFLWREEVRFKHLTAADGLERAGIASFGRAVAAAIVRASDELPDRDIRGLPAEDARAALLASGAGADLGGLMALAWGLGIPIVHLRVLPWPRKRMAAMTVRVGGRSVVLLAKDAGYPPWSAFYLAHELGHIALGHVPDGAALVDLDQGPGWSPGDDVEEQEADRWALQVLTGMERPQVTADRDNRSAASLARAARAAGARLGIDPGTIALAFGYTSGEWRIANGSLKVLFGGPQDVPAMINAYASRQLDIAGAGEAADFLLSVMGLDEQAY